MAVTTKLAPAHYGIQEDLIYSFPVIIKNHKITVCDLEIDDFAREKMEITYKELLEERNAAMETCQD